MGGDGAAIGVTDEMDRRPGTIGERGDDRRFLGQAQRPRPGPRRAFAVTMQIGREDVESAFELLR